MTISRITRIHFVYQFIILTLLVFVISCSELLPDKRFSFLALIPVFSYQMIIFFCCTELLPLTCWLTWTEAQDEVSIIQERSSDCTGSSQSFPREESPKGYTISPAIARISTKNKETPDSVTSSDATTQTICQSASEIFKKTPVFTKASARRSESTKSYVFTYDESKFEDSSDAKGNVQSYRANNWRSLQDQKGAKSQSNLISSSHPIEETKNVLSPAKLETLEESIESDLTELNRSASFPLRQRKHGRRIELDDNLMHDLNMMPAWSAIDYFGTSTTNKRRKSVSTEAIDRELRLINSHFEQNPKRNDFTQSMEVAKESIVEPVVTKKGLKSSASFNKWKQGVTSYFNKTKRDNIKTNDVKQDNKQPFFKELFSSKDVLCQGTENKSVLNSMSRPVPNFGNRVKLSPSYISYKADFFGEDKY